MRRREFTPPNAEHRLKAIGPAHQLPEPLRRALEPGTDFAPIPIPGPNDWLANRGLRAFAAEPAGCKSPQALLPALGPVRPGRKPVAPAAESICVRLLH